MAIDRAHDEKVDISNKQLEDVTKKNIILSTIDLVFNFCRGYSFWPLTFGLACCAIEMMATGGPRYDFSRFGYEVYRPSPRHADLLIVAGTITKKSEPVVRRVYDQMAEPKYVIAMGSCAISGGPFVDSYNVVKGADLFLPVDVYVPGCPPRPEALLEGMLALKKKLITPEIEKR